MEQKLILSLYEAHHLLRHDVNNRLQVILGYLQLKRPEKAQEYLMETIKMLQRFSCLSKLRLPMLEAFLLAFDASVGGHNNAFSIQIESAPKKVWANYDSELAGFFMDILMPLEKLMINQKIFCSVSFDQTGEQKFQINFQSEKGILSEIREKITNTAGVYNNLHTQLHESADQELVLLIYLQTS